MKASLDTNVIIHLYKANLQSVLFSRFNKVFVYEFIRTHELANHAEQDILDLFDEDVAKGNIEIIDEKYLKKINMIPIFYHYVKEEEILYNSGDLGEVYAIALAKTLGCICLVTDDIKEYGPHYTLMRTEDSEVIPLAFYEVLFLEFLEGKMDSEKLNHYFKNVCENSGLVFNIQSKLKSFIRRFWSNPYTESEREWMKCFCAEYAIQVKARLLELNSYLKEKCYLLFNKITIDIDIS